jgi:hypothetical protein
VEWGGGKLWKDVFADAVAGVRGKAGRRRRHGRDDPISTAGGNVSAKGEVGRGAASATLFIIEGNLMFTYISSEKCK